jgi:transposase
MSTGAHRCLGKAGKLMEMHPSDLSGEELAKLEPLLPPGKHGGRPRAVEMRAVLYGIFSGAAKCVRLVPAPERLSASLHCLRLLRAGSR